MSFKVRLISAGLIGVLLLGSLGYGIKLKIDAENGGTDEFEQVESVYFWYTDDTMTEFYTNAAVQFHEANPDIMVIPKLADSNEFLETINLQSVKGENFPDVYLLSNDSLEKAYLAGLASEAHDVKKVLNQEHFGQSSLDAVSYRGRYVGYPLFFETSILVFNKTYLQDWLTKKQEDMINGTEEDEYPDGYDPTEEPTDYLSLTIDDLVPKTFDDILHFADEYDAPDGVEAVMKWDVSDIFYNYFFAGNYMIVGGPAGDDSENIDIYNSNTIQCMKVYQDLNQFFSIDAESSNYTDMIDDFIDGKFVFTIATSDVVERLRLAEEELKSRRTKEENLILAKEIMQKEGEIVGNEDEIDIPDEDELTNVYEFGYAVIPDLKESLGAQSLSVTDTLVINGYSVHKDAANRFAAFLSTDCAAKIYEKTGKVAASTDAGYKDSALVTFQEEYAKSIPLPKIVEASNFWVQLEITFTKIWTGEDIDKLLRELSEQIKTQITGKPFVETPISD